MTPADHGYARCYLCLCWRPAARLVTDGVTTCAEGCRGVAKFARWGDGGPYLPHAGSPVATGLDEHGDAL